MTATQEHADAATRLARLALAWRLEATKVAPALAGVLLMAAEQVETILSASPPPRPLGWHKGRHVWEAHDGYPRHAHSINGVLTIDPRDPAPHFAFGPPFPVREETCPTPTS